MRCLLLLTLLWACSGKEEGDGPAAIDDDADDDGFTAAEGDCNDLDAATHPEAAEDCDSIDNNCNGSVDEGVSSVWFPDSDADGFGDAANAITACESVDGTVPNADDCDDGSAATYPGATELCDGVDNDCDGLPDPNSCRPLETAEGRIHGVNADDGLGHALNAVGDLNGDGRTDLGVGAPGVDPAGAAYFFLGPVEGEISAALSEATFVGTNPGDDAGYSVAGLGDLDGDGDIEVGVGARNDPTGGSAAGAVFVLDGPVLGLYSGAQAVARLFGEDAGDSAGISLSPAGDVNGDGLADFLVGAPNVADGGISAGAAYLILGPAVGDTHLDLASARIFGEAEYEYAGQRIADLGDLNGDGFDDIGVASPSSDLGAESGGAVAIFTGPLSGDHLTRSAPWLLAGLAAGDHAGSALAGAGDVDGDGYADLLVGAPDQNGVGVDAGAAYFLRGGVAPSSSLSAPDAIFLGRMAGDHAGNAVDGAQDVDGDGFIDLLIGASIEDSGGINAGAAYLVRGPTLGTYNLGDADAGFIGEAESDLAGFSVSGLGDASGDGRGDLLIGAPQNDATGEDAGTVYFISSASF